MLVEIDKIIVNDRIRKDFGDIKGLANSIKTKGLINPPVVTPELELIAGERRYKALQELGYKQIEVRVMSVEDEEHMLNLEIDENEERKEFSKLERLDWARRLERIESIKAKERMIDGGVENFPQGRLGKTRDIVAGKLNIGSGKQYEKEKYIAENLNLATEEEKQAWDKGDISDHAMYKKIKSEKELLENKTKKLESEKQRLEQELQCEKSKPARVETKIVEKVIDKTDYKAIERMKTLEVSNKELSTKSSELERSLSINKQLLENYKADSEEYRKLKLQMSKLQVEMDSVAQKQVSVLKLTELASEIEFFLYSKLAPTKYKDFMSVLNEDVTVKENFIHTIEIVGDWYREMKTYINENNYENIITVEVN